MSRYVDLDQIEFLKVDGNEEFNHGVDCCINRLLEAEPIKVVSLDKVKKAREEIEQNAYPIVHGVNNHDMGMTLNGIFQVLDKLIEGEESE